MFLDARAMDPWPDQWAFLSSVVRMAPDAVEALADALRPVDVGPALSFADLAASITSAGDPSLIGQTGSGRNKPTWVVDIAMIQSLSRRDDAASFDGFDLVVVDECHHLPAVSFASCVERASTRRWPRRYRGVIPRLASSSWPTGWGVRPRRHEQGAAILTG